MATLPAIIEAPSGRVDATLIISNIFDQARAEAGEIDAAAIRTVALEGVLVDTGATLLCLPAEVIVALGLRPFDGAPISTATGLGTARRFQGAQLEVVGRRATVDLLELPAGRPPLLGVTPIEVLGIEPDVQHARLRLLPMEPNDTYITVL